MSGCEGLPPEVAVAVKWWGDQLRRVPKFDNGDKSTTGAMTFMLASMVSADQPGVDDEAIGRFQAELSYRMIPVLREGHQFILSVDYGPCAELADACKAAGITGAERFPWKTVMWIYPGLVHLRHGYGADVQELYCDKRGLEKLLRDAVSNVEYYAGKEPNDIWSEEVLAGEKARTQAEYNKARARWEAAKDASEVEEIEGR